MRSLLWCGVAGAPVSECSANHMPRQLPAYYPSGPRLHHAAGVNQRHTHRCHKRRRTCAQAVKDGPEDEEPGPEIDQLAQMLSQQANRLRQSMEESGEPVEAQVSMDGDAQPEAAGVTPVRSTQGLASRLIANVCHVRQHWLRVHGPAGSPSAPIPAVGDRSNECGGPAGRWGL